MSQEIEHNVDLFLKELNVKMEAKYQGFHKDDNEWEHDQWIILFLKDKKTIAFAYKTGIGLRAEPTESGKSTARFKVPGVTSNDIKRRTIYGLRYLRELELTRKPVAPTAASVLNSLLLDSGASTMSFTAWCNEFGYDTDSRKAEATYKACQEESDKLSKIFNGSDLAQLRTLTQDY